VGLFKIIGEESVSAGTRRITALTGKAALELVRQEEEALGGIAAALRVPAAQAADRVTALLDEVKLLRKHSSQKTPEAGAKSSADDLLAAAQTLGETRVVAQAVPGSSPDDLRQLIDVLRRKSPAKLAVLLASVTDGKVNLAAALTPDLVALGLHAGQWLKEVSPVVGGGGGGRPDLAQAGGKLPDKVPAALEKAREFLAGKLGA
jgi:alanyl-tRNA synthetase